MEMERSEIKRISINSKQKSGRVISESLRQESFFRTALLSNIQLWMDKSIRTSSWWTHEVYDWIVVFIVEDHYRYWFIKCFLKKLHCLHQFVSNCFLPNLHIWILYCCELIFNLNLLQNQKNFQKWFCQNRKVHLQ